MNNNEINKFVNGVQDAAAAGVLGLPSRDIPQSQNHIIHDNQVQANFVPQNGHNDYIGDGQTTEEIIRRNNDKMKNKDSFDTLFDELQTPLLLAVIYFIFQLPVVRKNLFKMLPAIFKKDGNLNLMGYVINSLAFSSVYYFTIKTGNYFSL